MSRTPSRWLSVVLIAMVACTALHLCEAGVRSEFVRIADPNQPIRDMAPIINERCDGTRKIDTPAGSLAIHYPSECEAFMDPFEQMVAAGFKEFARLLSPLSLDIETRLFLVQNRWLPDNVTFKSPEQNALVIILDGDCEVSDWHLDPQIWRQAIHMTFHETFHVATAGRFGKDVPLWIEEGAATYVAHRVSTSLDVGRVEFPSALAHFIAMPSGQLPRDFQPFTLKNMDPSQGFQFIYRYERALGAFLAADRINPGLFGLLVPYLDETDDQRSAIALAPFDELHSRAQTLRGALVSEAVSALAEDAGNETALLTLAWLGECPVTPDVEPYLDAPCESGMTVPAAYAGACLTQGDAEAAILALISCDGSLDPERFFLIDAYARRFPQASLPILVELLEANSTLFAAWSHQRLVELTDKKIKFDAYGSAKNKKKSVNRWRRWLDTRQE